jgi:ElaB/YqjD/DUF883 family membrane-anchored ribosome-binding protein
METDRIEADVNESRSRLNDTIEALGSKLSPGQVIDEVLGLAQGQAGAFAANLGRQVRDNPLPTILIGAGIVMLLMQANAHKNGASDGHHNARHWNLVEEARWRTARLDGEAQTAYEERLHGAYAKALDLKQEAGEMVDAFKRRVSSAVASIEYNAKRAGRKVTQALADAKDSALHAASDAKHFAADNARLAREKAAKARDAAVDFYGDSPLAAGAIAVAVGAIIGACTPLTELERDAFDGAVDQAMRTGAKLAEQGAGLVERAASTISDRAAEAVH